VEIDPSDYQVALERAQAAYSDAMAQAQAAQVNVPITSVGTSSQVIDAEGNVQNATAGVAMAQRQLEAAQALLEETEANNLKAQNDLGRYKQLVDKQEISQQQYDQATAAAKAGDSTVAAQKAQVAQAEQGVVQSKAKLSQAQASLRSANTAPQQLAVTRSKAQSAQALANQRKAELDQAQLNLQYTKIVAAVSGIVSNRTVEVGQNVAPGQELMKIINLDDIWVTANFKENQLREMRVGQQVTISVDAYDKKYKGKVESVAGASGSLMSLLPPENATGNYVKVVQRIPVKIIFDAGETKEHLLRPGMSVEPKVWIK
jgi:membrane fusion protein (multidrug efflux system)